MKRLIKLFAMMAILVSGVSADTIYVTTSGTLAADVNVAPSPFLPPVFPAVASFQASFAIDLSLLLDTGVSQTLTDYSLEVMPFPGAQYAPAPATITPSGLCPQYYYVTCISSGVADFDDSLNEVEIEIAQNVCTLDRSDGGIPGACLTNYETDINLTYLVASSGLGLDSGVYEYGVSGPYLGPPDNAVSTSTSESPEPSSTVLFLIGAGFLGLARCRKPAPTTWIFGRAG